MLNKAILMGRLTRDPELRHTQNNTPVASFTLAIDRGRKDANGQSQTDFIDIVAWRQTAEFVSKYFTKGSMVAVSGRLQMRDWTDRDGNKRTSAEVVAENVYFGESKRREGGDYSRPAEPRDSYGNSSYGGSQNNYGGNSYGGYDNVPKGGSAFAELDDGDGELPF